MQLKPIEEQVVVVFGASSGIGREAARRFAQRGAKVVVSARGEKGLASLAEEIRQSGGEVTAITADVTDYDQVAAVADHAVATYGRLDTWIHCAAVTVYARFDQHTPEEFHRVIDTNLVGQAYGALAALPHLKREGRGALIHISSVEAKLTLPYQSSYAASKHGIAGFLDGLRLELQKEGVPISVTNVMPSTIDTPFYDNARTKIGVRPIGYPPVYEVGIVADAILHAAEHPEDEIIVGDFGKLVVLTRRLWPALVDKMLLWTGFRLQRTNRPKSEDAPDNLYGALDQYNTAEGTFRGFTLPSTLSQSLASHPKFSLGLAAGTVAAAALWRKVRG